MLRYNLVVFALQKEKKYIEFSEAEVLSQFNEKHFNHTKFILFEILYLRIAGLCESTQILMSENVHPTFLL